MATLFVTFSRIDATRDYDPPIAQGRACRTEAVTIPETGELVAAGEQVVELLADADCWVAIGASPNAGSGVDRRPLKAGVPYTFGAVDGDKVAVATRS